MMNSLQLVVQAGRHFGNLLKAASEIVNRLALFKLSSNFKDRFQFANRTYAHIKKANEVRIGASSVSVSNICWDRECGSLNLTNHPELLIRRKCAAQLIEVDTKHDTLLPNLKTSKAGAFHFGSTRFYSKPPLSYLMTLSRGGSHR